MELFDAAFLASVFRFVTPILLASLGGLLCERAGLFNVALEGLMLSGAFAAVAASFFTGSPLLGVLVAMLAGGLLASLLALFAVGMRANEVVVGLALNLLASGLTVYLLRALLGVRGAFRHAELRGLDRIVLPGVDGIPVLGPLLSGHSFIVYLSWLLVPIVHLVLFRTPLGLRWRGAGEHAEAAVSLGVSVGWLRASAAVLSGALCGLAGAQLSLANVTLFVEDMSAGRGWMAVVAVMLGRAQPFGVLAASLIFGCSDSLGVRLQGLGLPSQLSESLPYVVTLVSLIVVTGSRRGWIGGRAEREVSDDG